MRDDNETCFLHIEIFHLVVWFVDSMGIVALGNNWYPKLLPKCQQATLYHPKKMLCSKESWYVEYNYICIDFYLGVGLSKCISTSSTCITIAQRMHVLSLTIIVTIKDFMLWLGRFKVWESFVSCNIDVYVDFNL